MTIAAAKTIAPARLNSFRRWIAEPTSSGIPAMTAISPIPELRLFAISSPNDCKRPSGSSGFVICILDPRKGESPIPRHVQGRLCGTGICVSGPLRIAYDFLLSAPSMGFSPFSARSLNSVNRVVGQTDSPRFEMRSRRADKRAPAANLRPPRLLQAAKQKRSQGPSSLWPIGERSWLKIASCNRQCGCGDLLWSTSCRRLARSGAQNAAGVDSTRFLVKQAVFGCPKTARQTT